MNQTLLIWLFGGVGACLAGILKLWWDHVKECRDRVVKMAAFETRLDSLSREVGDHEHGIRGNLHELRNQISPMYMDWQRGKR